MKTRGFAPLPSSPNRGAGGHQAGLFFDTAPGRHLFGGAPCPDG